MRLRILMGEARMFVRGVEREIGGEDAQERVLKGFQILIDKVYVNLPMLRGVTYTEAEIGKAASAKGGLFGGDDAGGMSEPEQEILNYVQAQARIGVSASVKTLIDRFGTKPYGWPPPGISPRSRCSNPIIAPRRWRPPTRPSAHIGRA